jgi:hypothetical protein
MACNAFSREADHRKLFRRSHYNVDVEEYNEEEDGAGPNYFH